MDPRLKSLISEDIVREACMKYGITLDDLTFLGGFQNFVYEYRRNGQQYILRLTHSSIRSTEMVAAELEWILYLAEGGVPVSKPMLSINHNLFEIVQLNNSCFTVAAFDKARGKRAEYPDCLHNVELFEQCGMITGLMHKLAKAYNPSIKRHEWHQNYYLQHAAIFIPSSQQDVLESITNLMNTVMKLKQTNNSYGLIHGDISVGNFMVDHGAITLFDFDECQYSWFVEDIAVQLYYMVYVYGDDSIRERNLQYERFMEYFMLGYSRESTLSEDGMKQLPLFLRLREIIVYTGMYRSFDMSRLNQWTKDYLAQSKQKIETGISIV